MGFYDLLIDIGKNKGFAYAISAKELPVEKVNCSVCGREWSRELLLNEETPLSVVLSNDYFPDFMSYGYHILISKKAKESLSIEGVSGYHLGDVQIISANNLSDSKKSEFKRRGYRVNNFAVDPIDYYRLFIDGMAELDEKSQVELVEKCDTCGFKKYRKVPKTPWNPICIRKDSWDGSDLFRVKEYPAVVYCTDRFYQIYDKYRLLGLSYNKVISV